MRIVDFYADWCGPCRMMDPIIKSMMQEYPHVEVFKVNVDQNADLVKEYNVSSIPTLVFVKDEKEVGRLNGFASKDAIRTVLNKNI